MHAPAASSQKPCQSRRVLVVEDNADSRDTLRMILETWGHAVEVAEDGGVGVEKALAWKPEVAVVDIGLPVLDGYELARKVRDHLDDEIVLIALTGYSQPEARQRAFEAGFNAYLSKPADLELLSRLVVEGKAAITASARP